MNLNNDIEELLNIGRANENKSYHDMDFKTVTIDRVKANSLNTAPMTSIDELSINIKDNGLRTALIAYKEDDNYILLSGHRRRLALIDNGINEVPVIEVPKPENQVEEKKAIVLLNAQREETDDDINQKILEIADLYEFEKSENPDKALGRKNDYISSYIGLSARTIATRLKALGKTKEISQPDNDDEVEESNVETTKKELSNKDKALKLFKKMSDDVIDVMEELTHDSKYINKDDFTFDEWEQYKESMMILSNKITILYSNMKQQDEN